MVGGLYRSRRGGTEWGVPRSYGLILLERRLCAVYYVKLSEKIRNYQTQSLMT